MIVAVKVPEQVPWSDVTVHLDVPSGTVIETPALRREEGREVDWRLKATQEGRFQLKVKLADREFQKEVRVGDRLARVIPSRRGPQLLAMGIPGYQVLGDHRDPRYYNSQYDGEIWFFDAAFGDLLKKIQDLGLLKALSEAPSIRSSAMA